MDKSYKTSRVLGVAFLLDFATSFFNLTFVRPALIVPGNISDSMTNIADHSLLMRGYILLDMLLVLAIIFLGASLFLALRKHNEIAALVAFGLFQIEAALLAVSRIDAFSLLRMSQEYVTSGRPADLLRTGNLAVESMDFGGMTLHMLAFCLGAIIFNYLMYTSRIVPRALSLWGLVAIVPCLIATLIVLSGHDVPFFLYVSYVPFEPAVGVWILIKGTNTVSEVKQRFVSTGEMR